MLRRALRVMVLVPAFVAASVGWTNGGPFVVKYPEGDPAAKGVLARLGPDLKPTRETRLRVVKEDLSVTFGRAPFGAGSLPVTAVSAGYTIENPTAEEVQVDFGFPILRGVYLNPFSMMPQPDVEVTLGEEPLRALVISNSAIYGIMRAGARRAIDRGLARDGKLADLVDDVRARRDGARDELETYLTATLNWSERDAALLVAYAGLELGVSRLYPRDRSWGWWVQDQQLDRLVEGNLGPLAAIGEQKATQLFAQLAGRFEPETAAAYEAIFTAWGGDVRERSVDLRTGEVRPREIDVESVIEGDLAVVSDPTIYARIDYLDENADLTEAEVAACKSILRNLPVVFTFAPMNLLYYRATFAPRATCSLTVRYSQYAYRDTRDPASYQLAYVVHPASLWDDFGPITLEVAVPEGVGCRASVPCEKLTTEERGAFVAPLRSHRDDPARYDVYRGIVAEKTGELFVAVEGASWDEQAAEPEQTAQTAQPQALP